MNDKFRLNCQTCGRPLSSPDAACETCQTQAEPLAPEKSRLTEALKDCSTLLLNLILLSYPVWGTFVTLYLMFQVGKSFFYFGIYFSLCGFYPIVRARWMGRTAKTIICVVYFFMAIPVIFFTGWFSICWFSLGHLCPH